jgi:outer membrane receptor protein involved in Fe transport
VTEFAAFGAAPGGSVFGTAVASSPFSLAGGKAAFGGVRNVTTKSAFDDDDDDDDDMRQKVDLREDSITFDQVRRLLTTSGFFAYVLLGPPNCNAKCLEEC